MDAIVTNLVGRRVSVDGRGRKYNATIMAISYNSGSGPDDPDIGFRFLLVDDDGDFREEAYWGIKLLPEEK